MEEIEIVLEEGEKEDKLGRIQNEFEETMDSVDLDYNNIYHGNEGNMFKSNKEIILQTEKNNEKDEDGKEKKEKLNEETEIVEEIEILIEDKSKDEEEEEEDDDEEEEIEETVETLSDLKICDE